MEPIAADWPEHVRAAAERRVAGARRVVTGAPPEKLVPLSVQLGRVSCQLLTRSWVLWVTWSQSPAWPRLPEEPDWVQRHPSAQWVPLGFARRCRCPSRVPLPRGQAACPACRCGCGRWQLRAVRRPEWAPAGAGCERREMAQAACASAASRAQRRRAGKPARTCTHHSTFQ